jgi:hypothetical protein
VTTIQKLLFVLLVLLLGVGMLFYQTRLRDPMEGHLCVEWYKSARTLAESSIVDTKLPPLQRGRAQYTQPIPTCGELRKLGYVR